MLGRVSILVGLGVLVGAAVSAWASKFGDGLLYGLQPRDPVTLVIAATVRRWRTCGMGTRPRASRIDPADGLDRRARPSFCRSSGGRRWWAHLEFTRINITPTILRKKIEDLREVGASKSMASWTARDGCSVRLRQEISLTRSIAGPRSASSQTSRTGGPRTMFAVKAHARLSDCTRSARSL